MSSSEMWDPGTVAKVGGVVSVLRQSTRSPLAYWAKSEGPVYRHDEPGDVRPLLVLDPDDADQMREFADTFYTALSGRTRRDSARDADDMRVAVVTMLPKPTPVKPAEPTGLGAVIEDADGRLWLRVDWPKPWCLAAPNEREKFRDVIHGSHLPWDRVNAVRVLSEGVTP